MAQKFNKDLQFDGIAEGYFTKTQKNDTNTTIVTNAINTNDNMNLKDEKPKNISTNTKKTTEKKQTTKKNNGVIKETISPKEDVSVNDVKQEKSKGGRPLKSGLKNMQFSLTMNPILYEKLRKVADDRCRGNFSQLIDEAITFYCREHDINLKDIIIDEAIIDNYLTKQKLKQSKLKKQK